MTLKMFFVSGNDLAFCLWGSYAEQVENAVLESNEVWLLRFAKINTFRGNKFFIKVLFLKIKIC